MRTFALGAVTLALASACHGGGGATARVVTVAADLAFRDVRVFDGVHASEHRTVLVQKDRIVAVGAVDAIAVPPGAQVIDGAGQTLLPGLIDAHAHVNELADLRAALDFGVTTEIDMYSSPQGSIALAKADAPNRARVVPAGYGATVTGGHGTEYGVPVPTLEKAADADAFVAARVAEGSHHLKIILETGKELGFKLPSIDLPTATALVTAAHARKLLAVAHVGAAADVTEAIAAGVDGLAHLVPEPLDAATIDAIAAHHMFVIPTLTVLASICSAKPGTLLAQDSRIAALLGPDAARGLAASFPPLPDAHLTCDAPAAQVKALHAAGVRLLAGTDAPNPGTAHGASVHDELARLVDAGLSPSEALAAATSEPAAAFALPDLGVIRVGAIADLILVDGDPTHAIAQSRALRGVWRGGVFLSLDARRTAQAAARDAAAAASASHLGPLADFDRDDAATARFGAASDKLQGGTSTSKIELVSGGQTGRALAVSGTVIAPRGQLGWAGVSAVLGEPAMTPVDLTEAKRLRFWVRGQQGTLTLFLVTGSRAPSAAKFPVTAQWAEVAVDLTTLGPRDATLVLSWAATTPGPFSFQLDRVSLE